MASQLELERKDTEVQMQELRQARSALEELKAHVKELEEAEANVSRMQGERQENELEEPLCKAERQCFVAIEVEIWHCDGGSGGGTHECRPWPIKRIARRARCRRALCKAEHR